MNHPKWPCMASSHSRVVIYRLLESSTLEGIHFCDQLLHTLQNALRARLKNALSTKPQNHVASFRTGLKLGLCSNKNNWRTI
ncbi:hypothetical protein [Halopseudomonas bauzanensis]|uniref:Uncharacterized protein n=1 Tax=Halopseudomonas bauzanensis TaxID=653930 RepID=A0A4U0YGY7_9GAMM|nr:hypothetical protein [Halopseudomonas bauzanensis]TKA89679.1 hypothetical protein FA869_15870 [Halopseudomonas bauzanensis]